MKDNSIDMAIPVSTHRPYILTDGGPWAAHDMACAVNHQSEPAVFDIGTGVFHPSWKAQSEGWRIVKATTCFQRFCLWLGRLEDKDYTG